MDFKPIEEKIVNYLKTIYDPEIPLNIYDLGLIYDIDLSMGGIDNRYIHCHIKMTLTSAACPVADSLVDQVRHVASAVDEIDECYVELVWDPPWSADILPLEVKMDLGIV